MEKTLLKPDFFLDDQDFCFSQSLQTFFNAVMPDYSKPPPLQPPSQNPIRMTRSFSQITLETKVLTNPQRFYRFLRKMRMNAIIKWVMAVRFAELVEKRSQVFEQSLIKI